MIGREQVEQARRRIRDSVFLSPCAYSETFSRLTGLTAYLKLENLQMSGSFKERGALNKILSLAADERARGVICASAGNHAQGVAYHATRLGIASTIVMPEPTPLIKVANTREFGGTVVLHGANYDDAFAEARRRAEDEGLTFIHAFDDDAVIAGQGTIGLELLEQRPDLEAIIVPIGGGGLIAGIATAVKSAAPNVEVIGVQSERLPSAKVAIDAGEPTAIAASTTIADGIAVRRTGERTLPIIRELVDDIVTVDEEEIANAILLLLEREKTVAEGAGAVAAAAAINQKTSLGVGKKTAILVCGGNIDVNTLSRIIERGQAKDGRLVKLEVKLPDTPGALHGLVGVVAQARANIMEVSHVRDFGGLRLGETIVNVTLETRGPEHAQAILGDLRRQGFQIRRHKA